MYITIKTLWERCKNKSKIARLTGHDWKTVALLHWTSNLQEVWLYDYC